MTIEQFAKDLLGQPEQVLKQKLYSNGKPVISYDLVIAKMDALEIVLKTNAVESSANAQKPDLPRRVYGPPDRKNV
jgi:hypothetical protein